MLGKMSLDHGDASPLGTRLPSSKRQHVRVTVSNESGRKTDTNLKQSKSLSWRIGAYRQPMTVPARSAPPKSGTHGLLILKDTAVSFPPERPMTWSSPLNETVNEGALFHYYGATIPSLVYGVRPDGLWCPVRAMSMPCGFMYPSQFRWMLIMSETHQAARRGVSHSMSLYKRKAAAYQQLNTALADPVKRYSFETILSVNAALFVEARIVGPQITRMHLKALDQLYTARNRRFAEDKDSFAALLRLSIYTAYLMCECEAASYTQLQATVWSSLDVFRRIEQWVMKMRQYMQKPDPRITRKDKIEKFQTAKRRLLEHRAVKPLIAHPLAYMGYTHIASHFSVLLLLNLSVYELGPEIGSFFLKRLLLIIENSMDEDCSGRSLLKLPALPMMMAQARLDVLHSYTRQELGLDDDIVDESLETRTSMIDALKMFSYLGDNSRIRLIKMMLEWLTDELGTHLMLSKDVADELEIEIDCNWTAQQCSKSPSSALQ